MNAYDFTKAESSLARERLEKSLIGEMITLVVDNNAISFTAGEPSADLLPVRELKEAFATVFDDPAKLGYYWSDLGHIELRQWICEWMRRDGLAPDWLTGDNILMTCGSQEGINLISETLIDPASYVLVENPTYIDTLLTFRKQGGVCLGVPVDEGGPVVSELERILSQKKVRFFYTIPNFQNPSGYTATLERRKEVLAVLRKYDVPLVEDDPYHYLCYEGVPPSAYIKLSGDDRRVIYLGSFSKIIAPGVRCGWMAAPDQLMPKLAALRVNSCIGLPIIVQQGLFNMLTSLDLGRHIEHLCSVYRERRDHLLAALNSQAGAEGLTLNDPKGGFFIWGKLAGIDDMFDFARYAVTEEKVGFIPGSVFYASGNEGLDTIRFSFAKTDGAKAEVGAARLVKAIKAYRSRR